MSFKNQRASEDIKRELSDIIRELKDPRVSGLLSIVRLDLANDYSQCKVYVSSLEGIESTKSSIEGLKSAGGFIRRELSLRLKIRHTPELKFVADDGIEYSANINKIIKDIN